MKNILIPFLFITSLSFAQNDSTKTKVLNEIIIKEYQQAAQVVGSLGSVHQTYILVGKKSEVINVQDLPANIAEKTGRQIFAKIPGAFIYDMDGSGNQMNISTRGLDPHRSWEYNVRQNGIMTNSDIYGYPASHYSVPMEAVAKIEIIRGTSSLQYGSQFGGMINYITKSPDTTKAFSFENLTSAGSYGLFSSYNAISGRTGKFTYSAYYQKRVSDGYRKNAHSNSEAQFASLSYEATKNLHLKAEFGRSSYLYRLAGPLTDSMFYANPRQSTRSRNYFKPDIYLPSFTLDWKINEKTHLNWATSAVLGTRSSIQYIAFANQPDIIDPSTNQYKNRQIDIDQFNSYTSELRLSRAYLMGRLPSVVVGGVRYINNDLHRRQLGKGTSGTDYDLTLVDDFGRDLHFKTQNVAVFAENLINFTKKLSISAGIRYENGISKMSGFIRYLGQNDIPNEIKHVFPLFGASFQYQINAHNKIYGGWSQAYRPVIFADVIPPTALDKIDPNLKDALGYNAEIGIKGDVMEKFYYDITAFRIDYKNRIGTLAIIENGQNYILKTNTGNTRTNGIEFYSEWKAFTNRKIRISLFTASSYFDAQYKKGSVLVNKENKSIIGNKLEGVPQWISRSGLQFSYKTFSTILQYSYVSEIYSDALNTVKPNATSTIGIVPAYGIWDLNCSLRFAGRFLARFGVNNFTNQQYFTKRPTGYPGAGVWNSDGRSVVISIGMKI